MSYSPLTPRLKHSGVTAVQMSLRRECVCGSVCGVACVQNIPTGLDFYCSYSNVMPSQLDENMLK